jgi:tetratricopeptide (TPR) repeat protein
MALASQRSPDPALRLLAWQQALAAALRATDSAEDPHNAWYNLAVFRAAQNNYGATESALRSAIRAAPHWFKPHWMLARFLQQTGRLAEAGREAALADSLDAGRHPEVRQNLPKSFHP